MSLTNVPILTQPPESMRCITLMRRLTDSWGSGVFMNTGKRNEQSAHESRSADSSFDQFVAINRAHGIDPAKPESNGPVVYMHPDLVPMAGDVRWAIGKIISRAKIDRLFKRLSI